ncbi:uncharacterized protein LOC118191267 isoform X2 [Stegodyphus dumicola]|uniref:uncharacterized protein LOC118191267 isoform X2 n=1 Tax=Stegodyphus dumicola TaxID=202533 RepID=UPI0015ACC73B|nr:uncharacterized protein LOC118191267 isoform X2 [Stegodyphus dumicola]
MNINVFATITDGNSFRTNPPDTDSFAPLDLLDEFPIDKNIQCPEKDAQFPYPGDCSRYITCKNYEAHLRQCPPGLYFDSLYLYCRQDFEAACEEEIIEHKRLCGTDEEYLECSIGCEKTCKNFEKYALCSDVCVQGCFCKSGLVRGPLRLCIPAELCKETNSLFPWFMNDL